MPKNINAVVGIEFDRNGLRAARVAHKKVGEETAFVVESVEELRGDFTNEVKLVEALGTIKHSMVKAGTRVATCLMGKQVYVAEVPFQRLHDEEMESALRFELRKTIPFDTTSATLDYQITGDVEEDPKKVVVLVAAVANGLLEKHNDLLHKAGIKADVVDVLPITIANVLWTKKRELPEDTAAGILYLGAEMSTFVVEGAECPFFNRNIYFAAGEVLSTESGISIEAEERKRRIDALAEEILRTLSFYRQTYSISEFDGVSLIGEYAGATDVAQIISSRIALPVEAVLLADKADNGASTAPGKFELAISLGMRTDLI